MAFTINYRLIHTRLFQQVPDYFDESVHLATAGDSSPSPGVANSGLCTLFLSLSFPARPKSRDCLS